MRLLVSCAVALAVALSVTAPAVRADTGGGSRAGSSVWLGRKGLDSAIQQLQKLKTIRFSFEAKGDSLPYGSMPGRESVWLGRGTLGVDLATGAYRVDATLLVSEKGEPLRERYRSVTFSKDDLWLQWVNPELSHAAGGSASSIYLSDTGAGLNDLTHFALGLWVDLWGNRPLASVRGVSSPLVAGVGRPVVGASGVELTSADGGVQLLYSAPEATFTQASYYSLASEEANAPRLLTYRVSGSDYIDAKPVRFPTKIVFESFDGPGDVAVPVLRVVFTIDPQSVELNADLSDFLRLEIPASVKDTERMFQAVTEAVWADGSRVLE